MHVSSNRPVSEDEEKLMMYSPGSPFILLVKSNPTWSGINTAPVIATVSCKNTDIVARSPLTPIDSGASVEWWDHSIWRRRWLRSSTSWGVYLYMSMVTPCLYYDWTTMEKLILLVSEYLCLYQMELPEYNNIIMKNNAWRNISFAMRLPYYFSGYSIS